MKRPKPHLPKKNLNRIRRDISNFGCPIYDFLNVRHLHFPVLRNAANARSICFGVTNGPNEKRNVPWGNVPICLCAQGAQWSPARTITRPRSHNRAAVRRGSSSPHRSDTTAA
jgi:hypothetical protein